jgi:hypothetical protein
MYIDLHVNYPLLVSDFNETWGFSKDFKNDQISNFMKIPPLKAELFHAEDGRKTEVTNLIVAFCNFAKAPKNYEIL